MTRTVLIAGATGYAGRFLVEEYMRRGWTVVALVRKVEGAPKATRVIQAEATKPETLCNVMDGVDLVVSALGITRQRDGLTYQQVDYQANANLLHAALQAKVQRFAYIHVLRGQDMAHLPAIAAKQAFVNELKASDIESTVIAPCGFFSDMGDFLEMARGGRVWLFGDGQNKMNPIHGEDLAEAVANAIDKGVDTLDVGGPDVFTQQQIAELAFDCIGKVHKISYLWDGIRRFTIKVMPWITPLHVYGPVQFFLTAMGMDMVGECCGRKHLKDHFMSLVEKDSSSSE